MGPPESVITIPKTKDNLASFTTDRVRTYYITSVNREHVALCTSSSHWGHRAQVGHLIKETAAHYIISANISTDCSISPDTDNVLIILCILSSYKGSFSHISKLGTSALPTLYFERQTQSGGISWILCNIKVFIWVQIFSINRYSHKGVCL